LRQVDEPFDLVVQVFGLFRTQGAPYFYDIPQERVTVVGGGASFDVLPDPAPDSREPTVLVAALQARLSRARGVQLSAS
jgi:hypothetical protein